MEEIDLKELFGSEPEYIYTEEYQAEIIREIVKKFIPGLEINHIKIGTSENLDKTDWKSIILTLDGKNARIEKSEYFLGKGTEMVHFTKLKTLIEILNNPKLRLYNLYNLDDPREFEFANRIFQGKSTNNTKILKDAKENLYITSFCKSIIFNKKTSDEFNMWRLYGDDGKGVALKFEVLNDPKQLTDFHISNIKYGSKNRDKFYKIINEIKSDGRITMSVFYDFGKLNIFHKSNLYTMENEIRLLYDRRQIRTGYTGNIITDNNGIELFPNILKDEKKVNSKYFELDLFSKTNKDGRFSYLNSFSQVLPLLKIVEIKFGYKCEYDSDQIVELAQVNLGYVPKMKDTRLKRYFFGY